MTKKKRKNNLLLDVRREIRHSRKRFLSLFLLSALAVAFLSGLRTTAPDMEYTADLYYKAQNLMDLQLVSTVGWSEENLQEISQIEGVRQAEGEKRVDATYENLTVSMLSLPEIISLPKLTQGRLPSALGGVRGRGKDDGAPGTAGGRPDHRLPRGNRCGHSGR